MLNISVECPFVITPSVDSNVYLIAPIETTALVLGGHMSTRYTVLVKLLYQRYAYNQLLCINSSTFKPV